jgi:adenosylcobinamide-GDP ribazoletransferase
LSLAATFIVTGGLHEDGLADTADGFGGGTTPDRKLEIMRDSLIGTYGAGALVFSILLRVAAIANLTSVSVMPALIAAHAAARGTLPLFMWLMPNARADGLSAMTGNMSPTSACVAAMLGAVILVLGLGTTAGLHALLLLAIVMVGMGWLALHHVGGQTGDILGALEQAGEIAVLLVAAGQHI